MMSFHGFHGISYHFSLQKTKCIQQLARKREKREYSCQKFFKRTGLLPMNIMYALRKEGGNFSPISLLLLSTGNDSTIKHEKANENPMKRSP